VEEPGISEDCTQLEIDQWVDETWLKEDHDETGVVEVTDQEIIDYVQGNDGSKDEVVEKDENVPSLASSAEAEVKFSTCLFWLEQQTEATLVRGHFLYFIFKPHYLHCKHSFKVTENSEL